MAAFVGEKAVVTVRPGEGSALRMYDVAVSEGSDPVRCLRRRR